MPRVHKPSDAFVFTTKVRDVERKWLVVKHFIPRVKWGDFMVLEENGFPRRYRVLDNQKSTEAGVWEAELKASPPPVTILGHTYSAD